MKNLRLVFHESKLVKRKDEQTETLTFKGYWENDAGNPPVTLSISKCENGKALEILQELDIAIQGEYLYLDQGVNPQRRLDQWVSTAVRRKAPKVEDFQKEIDEFDNDMLNERQSLFYDELSVLINTDKTETKKFDFILDCFNAVRTKIAGYENPTSKEDLIANVRGITTAAADPEDDWEEPDESEEE